MSSAPPPETPSPETPRAGADLRCRSCGAKVRAEETWCSLCHTLIASDAAGAAPSEPVPSEPAPASAASAASPASAASAASAGDEPGPGPHEHDPEAVAAADRLLAQLAADENAREDPWNVVPKGGLSGRRGMALAVGGGVAFALVIVLGLTLLGLFL